MQSPDKKPLPVIFLMGPTASGKTELAMELHQKLNCELISVDSALVYKGLDIGTAKPTAKELAKAPHHLIDICEPDQPYSASRFVIDARKIIDSTLKQGRIPVLVGGTMLYFMALRDGLADLPKADPDIRNQLAQEGEEKGLASLHNRLAKIDPESAARIKPGDPQRIKRALEVFLISGKTLSQFFKEQQVQPLPFPLLSIAIAPTDRQLLRERIKQRFELMLEQGFLAEVELLYRQRSLSADLPAMRSVGYRQAYQYFSGEFDLQTMSEKAITATRRLAKRQMTWLRKWPELHWLETADPQNFIKTKQLIADFSSSD
ncbi:MAG: tRNA (adenosine(37)-N6)-dimethylallyltransferase MiaA [Gammaproteobacteria bacterium]|nr:MAG: tRNA (adenosine(37)-N6)-dimethylallyltransferase MiaA [Gammaproteobacteria bacterium]